jgi:predicted nucleic acid-binding protein
VAGRDSEVVDKFFSDKGIVVHWNLSADVWRTAGVRYGAYARRQQRGDAGPRRILADFLIGAHALHLAHALLTSNTRIYGTYFMELEVISPQDPSGNPGGTP